jgi:hypothetical protein
MRNRLRDIDVFDWIEKPPLRMFHYVYDLAKLKAARDDPEYARIEALRHDVGAVTTNGIRSTTILFDFTRGLGPEQWHYQDEKICELTPSLKFWHSLQLAAKKPRKWWIDLRYAIQRARRGYDDAAIYDFYSWHAKMCTKVLTAHRDHRSGHPGQMTPDEWKMVLDGLIDAFERVQDEHADPDELQKRVDFAFKIMSTYYLYLWD